MSSLITDSKGKFTCFVCGVPREVMFDVEASSDTFKVCYKCVEKYGKADLAHEGDRLLGEGYATHHNRVKCRFGSCPVQLVEDDRGTAPLYCRQHMEQFAHIVERWLHVKDVQGVEEK